jgi:transcriptional regulator with XRE-family HTH domain
MTLAVQRFGEKLRTLRERRQLSQTRLGLDLGYADGSFISQVETSKKKPTAELVLKVSEYFGVSTDALLRDEVEVGEDTP